ncbi:hypothetical protein [Sphaerisporangium sp. TRM90804]|uniref:hypothetical protein n=1 Tax=Sphaerisporangium sp. TRM90804 TaxID=3031113 RepID=UPI002449AA8A|nr:hypothetical protein [Sphaerisporangium sp. TRM90804]MDH2429280.1 hypothetical protein [Sphaerisporangium sp. TRM90804]
MRLRRIGRSLNPWAFVSGGAAGLAIVAGAGSPRDMLIALAALVGVMALAWLDLWHMTPWHRREETGTPPAHLGERDRRR